MKNLILLLVFGFMFTSCSAQKIKQVPVKKVIAYVDKIEGAVRLDPTHDASKNYFVNEGEFLQGKEYVFWLEVVDCDKCRSVKAVVVAYAITTNQAQRDQEEQKKLLSNRTIIR